MSGIIVDAKKLRELVKQSGFRTDFLASKVGLKAPSLRLIMNGKRQPSAAVFKLIALELGVETDALLAAPKAPQKAS